MAYLAVNRDCTEMIFQNKPIRAFKDSSNHVWAVGDRHNYNIWYDGERIEVTDGCTVHVSYGIELPPATIKKLVGKELTWSDKPVKI